jgi:hypothetical protein
VYIIFELIFLNYTRCILLQLLLVNINLKKRLKKITPIYWEVDEISDLSSINRPFMKYRVWVIFKGKYDTTEDIRSWILLDRFGNVENKNIIRNEFEELVKKLPKENKRASLIEQLLYK